MIGVSRLLCVIGEYEIFFRDLFHGFPLDVV
jgi:hypothetical protein